MKKLLTKFTNQNTAKIYPYLLLFLISSFLGWAWEVLVYWWMYDFSDSLMDLILHYRGVLHGPWAPIYGFGVLLLAAIWYRFRNNKFMVFVISIVACGLLEYLSGLVLELLFHKRWWDYTGWFLNIDGKICFISVFGFGVIGAIVMLLAMPCYLHLIKKCPLWLQRLLSIVLLILLVTDAIYSHIMLLK